MRSDIRIEHVSSYDLHNLLLDDDISPAYLIDITLSISSYNNIESIHACIYCPPTRSHEFTEMPNHGF